MSRELRVLIVDDSAYVRKVFKEMLTRSPDIEVVGTARDGDEALEPVERLHPDVVTSDLIMPRIDGVEFIRRQMAIRPVPIVVVSIATESSEQVLSALDAGRRGFRAKADGARDRKGLRDRRGARREGQSRRRRAAGRLRVRPRCSGQRADRRPVSATGTSVLVIGVSTGGPQGLRVAHSQLPADFPVPVAIVLHMPVGYTEAYASVSMRSRR